MNKDSLNSRLIVKDFGAIKDVDITINKVNVIIGKQSSGKSTIVKLLSFFQWAEKRYIIEGKFQDTVEDMLQKFHRIGDEYFSETTYVAYISAAVSISFDGQKKLHIQLLDKDAYLKSKNIYIPAERNFATTIPNLGRYNESNDNIMNLLYDWNDAKKQFVQDKEIMNLNISFSHDSEKNEDYIHFQTGQGGVRRMPLMYASSGLQSLTPIVILFDYLTGKFYDKDIPLSVLEKTLLEKELLERGITSEEIIKRLAETSDMQSLVEDLKKILLKTKKYYFSSFIIEEPEQNLYPETQKELVYYLLKKLSSSERPHRLFITTHSPFILYSLNNCMIGGCVQERMPQEEQEEQPSRAAWIDPSHVSVWQLENGKLASIKDDDTKVIGTHSFNTIMNNVMGEYFDMLGYLGK